MKPLKLISVTLNDWFSSISSLVGWDVSPSQLPPIRRASASELELGRTLDQGFPPGIVCWVRA